MATCGRRSVHNSVALRRIPSARIVSSVKGAAVVIPAHAGIEGSERYCDNLATELAGWRTKFDDVVRKFDRADTGDKSKVYPHVNELHMILEEFEDRIRQVKPSCATGGEPEKFEFEVKFTGFRPIYRDVWQNVSPGDIGG
jgi:hypothetical protein